MTTEELKAHRRTICEALIEGKQCQYHLFSTDDWVEQRTSDIASALFASEEGARRVRIKPEPRKVWVGWLMNGSPCLAECDRDKGRIQALWEENINWQLVVEEPK